MTRRQRAGLGVIGLVLVLVAVIASRQTHLVAGSAQATPVSGPPAVGDCVLDPLLDAPAGITVTATSGGTVPVYSAQQIRPCSGTRYGEVVSVIATPRLTVVKDDGYGRYLDDPNLGSCHPVALQYVGIATHPILRFWQVFLQTTTAMSGPSPRQEAAGQHWAACIVTLRPADASTDPSASQRYGSSIRGALQTGRQRNQLGNCVPAVDWIDSGAGACGRPHALEVLAIGDSGEHPVNRSQVERTCRQLVLQLTAIPDPTAVGALSTQLRVQDGSSTAITTAQIPSHSFIACGVTTTGTRKLGGSLIALGRQPIPWA